MGRMSAERLIELIEEAGREARSYSGRGMYGEQCVGVDLDNASEIFGLGVEMANYAVDDEREDLASLRSTWDSMGLGVIIYFPGVRWPKGRDEDEADED